MWELMQRLQLFREGEGHTRLLLMLLISQAIYSAAKLGEGSLRRTERDAEKEGVHENEGKGHGLGKVFLFVLMSQLFSCAAFHLQIKSKGISFFFFVVVK